MKIVTASLIALSVVGTGTAIYTARAATVVTKEPATLRLGERVLVDDGSCPAGQIREVVGVSGKTPGATQIERLSQCISRKINR